MQYVTFVIFRPRRLNESNFRDRGEHREERDKMSSPRGVGGSVRDGTRVVLKEITATLHNSPPIHPARRKVLLMNRSKERKSLVRSHCMQLEVFTWTRGCYMHLRVTHLFSCIYLHGIK